jgi:hypothetical protein
MAETEERARWRKVWTDLWSTPSHVALDATALYVAVTCIVHASWERGRPEARLLAGAAPMPVDVLARICRLSASRVKKCLRQLEDAGTVEVVDGVITLPRFGRWQETADAARKRRARSPDAPPERRPESPPDSPVRFPGLRDGEGEAEGEAEAEGEPLKPPSPSDASDFLPTQAELHAMENDPRFVLEPPPDDLPTEVLRLMCEAVRDVTGKPGGPRDVPTNRDMIAKATKRERATLEDWRRVIAAQTESVRHKPDAWRYLCLPTITRPNNWARLADAPVGRGSARRGHARAEDQDHTEERF